MGNKVKLAISNIAWQHQENNEVFTLMQKYGFTGLEIAPTKLFPEPLSASSNEIRRFRLSCEQKNIHIVAMQSLLFGKPELTLFESEIKRNAMKSYLAEIMRFGTGLGITAVVFGSPKNRIIPESMSKKEANTIAINFFREMGSTAKKLGMFFCIEPNPAFYGTNFINTSEEAIDLVKSVDHPHFRFHLDTGALFLTGENSETVIKTGSPYMQHCHISEKGLSVITKNIDSEKEQMYKQIALALQQVRYPGWISIEMLASSDQRESNIQNIEATLKFVKEVYGN